MTVIMGSLKQGIEDLWKFCCRGGWQLDPVHIFIKDVGKEINSNTITVENAIFMTAKSKADYPKLHKIVTI